MAKSKKRSKSPSDSIERRLNSLTAAVLAMMEQKGQGASQTFRDFTPDDIYGKSAQTFSEQLGPDTVMEGPITDYADEVSGGRSGMSQNVAGRAGNKYMQDVYLKIIEDMRKKKLNNEFRFPRRSLNRTEEEF